MSNISTKVKKISLLLGDIMVLYLTLWLTLLARYQKLATPELWLQHFWPFTIIFIVWLIIFFIYNLYDLNIARNNVAFYTTLLQTLAWCAGVAIAFFYLIGVGIAPKTNLLIYLVVLVILLSIWRRLFNSLAKIKALQNNVMIVGLNEHTIGLAKEINAKPQLGLKITTILDTNNQASLFEENPPAIEVIYPPYNIKEVITNKKIKTIITAVDPRENTDLTKMLYECLNMKVGLMNLSAFFEKFTGKVPVTTIGQIWFLENLKEADKSLYEMTKRSVDIMGSFILGALSLIFLPLIWLMVKLDSHGPFFFKQTRCGRDSRPFLAIKIRSMFQNSEKNGPQWAQKNDPRVTKVGRYLRKTRIDEIPQLWNIMKGDLSFIGPRPERPEFVTMLKEKIPFYNERHLIKPGLTGWAQINFPYGASEADALEKLQYDLYYIKNRSLVLDVTILLKTIKTVLTGGGQ